MGVSEGLMIYPIYVPSIDGIDECCERVFFLRPVSSLVRARPGPAVFDWALSGRGQHHGGQQASGGRPLSLG